MLFSSATEKSVFVDHLVRGKRNSSCESKCHSVKLGYSEGTKSVILQEVFC